MFRFYPPAFASLAFDWLLFLIDRWASTNLLPSNRSFRPFLAYNNLVCTDGAGNGGVCGSFFCLFFFSFLR